MTELVTDCPLCGGSASAPFDQRVFKSYPVSNVICRTCGLVFQSPRMTDADSQAFYEAEYRLLYQGQEGPNPKDLAVQTARARLALEFIGQSVSSATRVLDIGCSTGMLLQVFQSLRQAQVYGVEPGNTYRQYAQSIGLQVYASLDELQSAGLPHFNLVTMMHVLEHLSDPVAYLQNLRTKFLDPDGWLLLEVPNLYAHDCFEVAHLLSFSAHTMSQVVQKAGYRIIQLQAHGQPRSQLIPLYLTLLAQPDNSQQYLLKPDHFVLLKRKLGFLRRRLAERLFPERAWIPIATL
jgi:2-polyprenyl-3-methyl-5-hydroxy-6-metoxy-1,4-benzoquinol methylase